MTQPIRYAKTKGGRRVYVMIALTWVISAAISAPIALGMNYTEARADTPKLCVFYNSEFLICSSLGSFYIPVYHHDIPVLSYIQSNTHESKAKRNENGD